jgi:hypothetical protein
MSHRSKLAIAWTSSGRHDREADGGRCGRGEMAWLRPRDFGNDGRRHWELHGDDRAAQNRWSAIIYVGGAFGKILEIILIYQAPAKEMRPEMRWSERNKGQCDSERVQAVAHLEILHRCMHG